MKLKKWALFVLLPVLLIVAGLAAARPVQAQTLKNAITDIKIWDTANGREATLINGAYQLNEAGTYSYNLIFDLSAYDGQLQNGDSFTFTVPEGMTVSDGAALTLTDAATQVALGRATISSSGSGQGGVVTVTIQNLEEYLAKSPVSTVKGSFFFSFQAATVVTDKEVTYKADETEETIRHRITIRQRVAPAPINVEGENLAKFGGIVTNRPYNSAILGTSGTYIHPWVLRINTQQNTYSSPIVITDTISEDGAPMQFIPETIILRSGTYTTSLSGISNATILRQGVDYTIEYNETYTAFTLTIPNPGDRAFMFSYSTTSPADGSLVANTASMTVDGAAIRNNDRRAATSFYVERSSRITDGGIITADISNSLILYKVDSKTGERLEGAVFKVTTPSGQEIILDPTDENGRTATDPFSDEEIAKGQFTVTEITAPDGYILDDTPVQVRITANGAVKTLKNDRDPDAKTKLNVTKKWDDADNQDGKRPSSVTVDILADGTKVSELTLTGAADADEWTGTTEELPLYAADGKKITYTLAEDQVDGYDAPVINQTDRTITNSRTPATTDYQVSKVWNDADDQDGKRPDSVTVQLYQSVDGGDVTAVAGKTLELTAADSWTKAFTGLPVYEGGKEIRYSVQETDLPEGYTATIDGQKITNTHKPETTTISGTKTWEDADDQDGKRPAEITISLHKEVDGQTSLVTSKTVTAADNWSYSFADQPVYEGGKKITYTITEDAVDGYTTKVDGYDVTNTHKPETTTISGTKTWDDADNQDGKRPAEITIKLHKEVDGKTSLVTSQTVTAADSWTYSFADQPVYEGGKKITYTITEDAVDGYTTKVDGYDVTNTYKPATVSFSVTKAWDDADNQDGKRPATVSFTLYQTVGGQKTAVETRSLTADSQWTTRFTDLPKYAGGQAIVYSVEEADAENYTIQVTGDADKGFTITNSYTPERTEVSGTKTWDDGDDQDGKRPEKITVKLLANGKETASQEVSAASGWAYRFTNLPTYAGGEKITYTIVEEAVDGYSASQSGYNLTNSYTPEVADITVTKTWQDGDNQDGKRPDKISVSLVKTVKGQETLVETKTITAADNWVATFTSLPVYEQGEKIAYSVTEEAVEAYTTEIKDFTITNSYTPAAVDYQVTKVWDDAGNQDGKRPASITIQLYKSVGGGAETAVAGQTLTLTADGQADSDRWTGSFTNLPQYEKGQAISYSVREDAATLAALTAAGYQASVSGQVVTNSRTPEQIKISGTKVWDDADNQDGKRPERIVIKIKDGETVLEEIEVSAATGWAFSSKDLPKYRNGQEIAYTVVEEGVTDYSSSQSRSGDGSYTITNSYTPAKTSVSGSQIWSDANNQDAIRPESVTVRLLADGKEVAAVVISSATGWNFSFNDLPKYKDGQEIVYSIAVDPIAGYETRVDGTQITSTHVPAAKPSDPGTNNSGTNNSGNNSGGGQSGSTAAGRVTDPASAADPGSGAQAKSGQKRVLPRTGEASSLSLFLAGLGASLLGGLLYRRRRVG